MRKILILTAAIVIISLTVGVSYAIEYVNEVSTPLETHPKCGMGTIFERETNSCILKDIINPEEWCGQGTYYNATEHACLLKNTIDYSKLTHL